MVCATMVQPSYLIKATLSQRASLRLIFTHLGPSKSEEPGRSDSGFACHDAFRCANAAFTSGIKTCVEQE